jgi:hypothetical protein
MSLTATAVKHAKGKDDRDDTRKLLTENVDPNEDKKAQKLARIREDGNQFETVAADWFKTKIQDQNPRAIRAAPGERWRRTSSPQLGETLSK